MLTIRSFFLDGVAVLGVVAGVAAGIGGYLSNMPELPEKVAVASAGLSDPDTTGSIGPNAQDDEVHAWVDPPYRRSHW